MKPTLQITLITALVASSGLAQGQIYRCGNEYTNSKSSAGKAGCKLVEGSSITVIPAVKAPVRVAAAGPTGAPRIDSSDQKSRDSDARSILESELKKAEARHVELLKEYNNGEPEKQGIEGRNHQKYLDRVAELKANLDRNASDIAGIKRELGRVPAAR